MSVRLQQAPTISKKPDSHFIPKMLIKNWALADGRLRYADLGAKHDRWCHNFPRTFFVSTKSWPAEIETALDQEIETPLGAYIDRCKRSGTPGVALVMTDDGVERRAIILTLLTQAARTKAQFGDVGDLAEVMTKERRYRDDLAKATSIELEFVGVTIPETQRLFFPSTGLFAIPGIGGFAFGLPTTPSTFVAMAPRIIANDIFRHWKDSLSMLSVGSSGDRVIVPPDSRATIEAIREAREHVRNTAYVISLAEAFLAKVLGFIREVQ